MEGIYSLSAKSYDALFRHFNAGLNRRSPQEAAEAAQAKAIDKKDKENAKILGQRLIDNLTNGNQNNPGDVAAFKNYANHGQVTPITG